MISRLKKLFASPWGLGIRLLISAGLLWIVLSRLNTAEILNLLLEIRWGWLGAALAIYLSAELLSARRWQILLRAQQSPLSLPNLFKLRLVGTFFNQFMISTIGGDTARFWLSARLTGRPLQAGMVLVADRIIGLFALLLVGAISALLGAHLYPDLAGWRWVALVGSALGGGALFVLLKGAADDRMRRWLPGRVVRLLEVISAFAARRDLLLKALLLSLYLQLFVVGRYYVLARALGIAIPPLVFGMLVPVALLVLVLPITFNGLGLREITFIGLFSLWGATAQQSTAFAWLDLAFGLSVSLVGGLIYLLDTVRAAVHKRATPIGKQLG